MAEDPKISQRYRELPREEPSRGIDAAILAAARRAAETRPAPLVVPSGRRRWYFPLAAAAIIVLAVAVTVQVERQQPDPELAIPPVTVPKAPAEEQPEPVKPAAEAEPARKAAPPQVFAPDPRPQAPPAESPRAPSSEMRAQRDAAGAETQAAPTPAPESPPADAARGVRESRRAEAPRPMASMVVEPPERWLERIAELRKQGKHDEADKALAEFRRAYPDYRISEAMLEKVEKK
jgi:hypothetical protein